MAVAYDAATEAIRTDTSDPYTGLSHTGRAEASGGVQGVMVLIANAPTATDQITGVTYGGVALAEVQQNTDTATEPGNTQIWFVGRGLSGLGGTQTVSVDMASGTTDDQHIVCVTFTASADLEVVARGGVTNNVANPSVTLAIQGRTAITLGVIYSGLAAPSNLTVNGNMSAVHDHDFGNYVTRVDRQTTVGTGDFTYSYTASTDDVAMSVCAISEVETTWDENFEGGTDGTNITVSNSKLSGVGTGGTLAFENTAFVPAGSTYARCTTSAGTRTVSYDRVIRAEGSLTVYRFYYRTANPTVANDFWRLHDSVGGVPRVRLDISTSGTINFRDGNTTRNTSTKALSANEWARFEVFVDETNNQIRGHMWWGAQLHDITTSGAEYESFGTRTWTQADFDTLRFGHITSITATSDFDGLAWRNASSVTDYIGPPSNANAVETAVFQFGIPIP
jgi:hypothetical protein